MSVFALIHGGGFGGWCWDPIVPGLEARGHTAIAPDLPIEDLQAGTREYGQVVAEALGDAENVIAVGHSLGGLTVPVVASMRPVDHMVFLGAMVPVPGMAYGDYLSANPDALTARAPASNYDDRGLRGVRPWEDCLRAYFHDCPTDVARAAWQQLRPQSSQAMLQPCPIDSWPEVPSTYILMQDDRSVSPAWSRRIARDRLGTTALELPGSHSPFLSRPAALVDVLCAISDAGSA